jgi:ABC-type lipoprotein export system ATPase subunit
MEKNKPLFEIKNLKCAYPKKENQNVYGKTVFAVDQLTIDRGKVIVLLGLSGSGKSTLLETLGLMTKTIQEGSTVIFNPDENGQSFDYLKDLWNGDETIKTKIREKNLNFIFQDTNLMHNFSNADNVSLADLLCAESNGLQCDTEYAESVDRKSKETLRQLRLPGNAPDKCPKNISGGERQRVAFARAIQPDFKVLFGDEPTGNLDDINAGECMQKIRDTIYTSVDDCQKKTAIIVSHNIDLSIDYADEIIALSRENDHFTILDENIFTRASNDNKEIWYRKKELADINQNDKKNTDKNSTPLDRDTLKKIIQKILDKSHKENHLEEDDDILDNKTTLLQKIVTWINLQIGFGYLWLCNLSNSIASKLSSEFHNYSAFTNLFYKNESKDVLGKSNKNFWWYFVILSVVYIIIGSANGALNDLRDKMEDPFINALEVDHKGGRGQAEIKHFIQTTLLEDSIRRLYRLDTVYEFNRFPFSIRYANHPSDVDIAWARTIVYDDPLLDKIIDIKRNNAIGGLFKNENDYGIIVTRDFLQRLGYSDETPWIYVTTEFMGKHRSIPLPVKAIVAKLPGSKQDLIMLQNLYDNYTNLSNQLLIKRDERLFILTSITEPYLNEIQNLLQLAIEEIGYDPLEFRVSLTEYDKAHKELHQIIISNPTNPMRFDDIDIFYERVMKSETITSYLDKNNIDIQDFTQIYAENYNYNPYISDEIREFDQISIVLNSTDNIMDFVSFFEPRTGIQIDMGKIENLNTFNWITNRTKILLLVLIFLSVYSILQYISQTLNSLLFRIRKNIGTLKAFGINVKSVYKILSFTYITSGYIIAVVFSALIGCFVVNSIWSVSFFRGFWELFFFFLPIIALAIGGWGVVWFAERKYFDQTPGDLIYDRIE